jgi:hypothetical protein
VSAPQSGGGSAALLRIVIDLCLLRRGPQDLPYSPALTQGLLLLGLGVDLLVLRWLDEDSDLLLQIGCSLALLLALPWLLLSLRQRRERYVQTLAAFAATGIVFSLLYLPLALKSAELPRPVAGETLSGEQALVAWGTLLVIGWKLAINGSIWRHALDWPRAAGVLLAVGLFLFELGLIRSLLTESG